MLADDRPTWRPDRFAYDLGGCRLDFPFPVVKLLDFVGREEVLQAGDNPALVARTHLATVQTAARSEVTSSGESTARLDDGFAPSVGAIIQQEAEQIEQEKQMPYVTSVE